MKEPPRRRITVTSSLKGISTEIGWWRGEEALLRLPLIPLSTAGFETNF
jgi:hypothetical protein